jgi:hypothetical protein
MIRCTAEVRKLPAVISFSSGAFSEPPQQVFAPWTILLSQAIFGNPSQEVHDVLFSAIPFESRPAKILRTPQY